MQLLALVSEYQTFWMISLGIGAVVLLVVIALLTLLLRIVQQIDRGVREVWETATRFASNTATTWQLRELSHTLQSLREEMQAHEELLDSRL
ncbi:MAG: hypothetical protein M3N57_02780 [Actinomycetota bacterium]|nr:hypothetical protein [Actinomycetota bacterium]